MSLSINKLPFYIDVGLFLLSCRTVHISLLNFSKLFCPILLLVQILLNGSKNFKWIRHNPCSGIIHHPSGIICNLDEGAVCPIIQLITEDVKQYWPWYQPLGALWSPAALRVDHNPLSLTLQPIFNPPHRQFILPCTNTSFVGFFFSL